MCNNVLKQLSFSQLSKKQLKVNLAEMEEHRDQLEHDITNLKNERKELAETIGVLQEKNLVARDALKRANIRHAHDEVAIKMLCYIHCADLIEY